MRSEHRPGDVIGGYRIEDVIGSGGMGWVYRARHALSGRVVAVKVQRGDTHENARARDRMLREAQILATLIHPGVPAFHETGMLADERAWIAMELVDGECLATRLRQGPLDPSLANRIMVAVAGVLAAAHARGLVHRDLKPDNIYLTPSDAYPVRVLDWGIAHDDAGVRFTNHDEAIGTPTYMAPEQARGGAIGGYCDVYGLGIIAYQMLSGDPPFRGNNPVEIMLQHFNAPVPALAQRCPDVTYGLVELVERMLSKRHDARPTASEIEDDTYDFAAPESAADMPTMRIRLPLPRA